MDDKGIFRFAVSQVILHEFLFKETNSYRDDLVFSIASIK